MLRLLARRLLACVLALAGGLAVPVSALAHGHEHHHQAEADAGHHGDDHPSHDAAHELSDPEPAGRSALEIEQLPFEDPGSHPHPCLDRARSNRVECPTFALLAPAVAVQIEQVVEAAPTPPVHNRIRPRALDHAPPPPSRAPPESPG